MSAIDRLNSVDYKDAIQHGYAYDISESILCVPFWQPWFCQLVIEAADEYNDYHPYDADMPGGKGAAPGQECRIGEFSPWLFERYKKHWMEYLRWPVGEFFHVGYLFDKGEDIYRMPFVLKYTMDTQTSMDPHHDASTISMAVMLNGDYDGSNLWFPHQRVSNKDVPIGWGTVFPGRLSHWHQATELKSGTRYGFTCWIDD